MNAIGTYNGTEICWDANGVDGERYINATQMCKAVGKLWGNYWQNDTTQQFVNALSLNIGIPINTLVVGRRGNPETGGGTWVHRKVARHLAGWCSPEFHVWMINKIDQLMTTGSVVLHREHQEAELIATRVWETLDQIAKVQLDHTHGLAMAHTKIDHLSESVTEIKEAINTRRIPLNRKTKKEHVETVHNHFCGKCPCCFQVDVVDHRGSRLSSGEFDHFFMRSKNGPGETWLVCKGCNHKLRDPEFNRSRRDAFNAYQQRRKEGCFPLFKSTGGG